MKHMKVLSILLALIFVLSMALPALAQDEEDTSYVGTIEILDGEDGDIVFTSEDGEVFIIAPAGSFSPSVLADYEEGTLFEIEGLILNEGDEDNPATIQVTVFAEYVDTDTDEDGWLDLEDNCPEVANTEQVDTDGDGLGDACDEFPDVADDMDNDGVADDVDTCPEVANPVDETTGEQAYPVDTDGDGLGDACEEIVDTDGDGVADDVDTCPEVANPVDETTGEQAYPVDTDGDGLGDACEEETDDEELGEGGFYCRNRDVEHPNGARIAEAYDVDYATLIADFCGDEGGRRGWGVIRNELRGDERGNGNGNSNGNNGNGNSNGNNGNGNSNGNNGNGNGGGNGNGRGN